MSEQQNISQLQLEPSTESVPIDGGANSERQNSNEISNMQTQSAGRTNLGRPNFHRIGNPPSPQVILNVNGTDLNWVESIPVTRKRTSIRRIFTWLTPDLARLRARHDEEEKNTNNNTTDEDPVVTHDLGENRGSHSRSSTIDSEERRMSYKHDIKMLEEIIPKISDDGALDLEEAEGSEVSASPKTVQVIIEEATCKTFSSPAFKLRGFKSGTSDLTDPVVVYTNAIRYHSRAMYALLFSLQELGDDITEGHLRSFYVWFEDYHDYFCNFITLINNTFLPTLRKIVPFRHNTPVYFGIEGERLNKTVAKTSETSSKLLSLYEDDVSCAVRKLVKIYSMKFGQQLCVYLYTIEKYAATICERFCTARYLITISKNMAGAFKELPNFHRSLPMLLRWLEHRPLTTCKWLTSHYDYITVRVYRWWRRPTEHERTLDFFRRISKTDLGI